MSDAYAELQEHNDAGTALALGAAGAFSKWVSGVAGHAGPSDLLVPSGVSHDITVGAKGVGVYRIAFHISLGSDKPAATVEASIFIDGVEITHASSHTTFKTANDQYNISAGAIEPLAAGQVIDLRLNSDKINTTLTIYAVNLLCHALVRQS